MPLNLPNILTFMRILMIPALVVVFYTPGQWMPFLCAVIFGLAALTDWADGYLARKMDLTTPFGAFLDPVADKVMVAAALVLMAEREASWAFTIPAMVIISREIIISALREWMAELGKRANVAVSNIGKVKTTMQMIAIIVLLGAGSILEWLFVPVGYAALYIAAALTLWSMVIYLAAAYKEVANT